MDAPFGGFKMSGVGRDGGDYGLLAYTEIQSDHLAGLTEEAPSRGIVYDGEKAHVTDALEVRSPGAGEVRVRMVAAGVCHSDQSVLDGTIPFPTPVVMGHEGAGIVEEIGSSVTTVAPGDHVVVTTLANCGKCAECARGWPTRCRVSMGNFTQPFTYEGKPAWNFAAASVFAEYTVVKEVQAVKIDKDVPPDVGVSHRLRRRDGGVLRVEPGPGADG